MRCLFCKNDSSNTKSVEHIVPESLGNKTFVLPIGYVCDKCNNYFARKVEKPFLEQLEMKLLRFQEAIPNKKNRIPMIDGILNGKYPVKIKRTVRDDDLVNEVLLSPEAFQEIDFNASNQNQIIFPAFTNTTELKCNNVISRFIAKMALEALALRVKEIPNSLEDLINDKQFDLIRNHARQGTTPEWPCYIRRIYDFDKQWIYEDGKTGEMIHESDFLAVNIDMEALNKNNPYIYTEIYFVVALWGIEFAINMAGPEIESYESWLKEHDYVSPLYYGKNNNLPYE